MTAEIIQFVPRPNPDRDRKLAEEAAKILQPFVETTGFTDTAPSEMIPYGGQGIDGMKLDQDPA
jgi:hypothetical protein